MTTNRPPVRVRTRPALRIVPQATVETSPAQGEVALPVAAPAETHPAETHHQIDVECARFEMTDIGNGYPRVGGARLSGVAAGRLQEPQVVTEATAEYQSEEDKLGR